MTCDFQQCGILTNFKVVSDEPVQPPFKLINSKWCSDSSLTLIEYSSDQQRLWSDCAHAQADLRLCWSHNHIVGNLMLQLKCYKILNTFQLCYQTKYWFQGWNSQNAGKNSKQKRPWSDRFFRNLQNAHQNSKQRRPWSDCFWRSSLIQEQSDLGLPCLSQVFWQAISVRNFRTFTVPVSSRAPEESV